MSPDNLQPIGQDLSERERQVLEAVVRTYVDSAEPAGSRTLAKRFDLRVSPATVRNTMSDLEAKGYLFHRHTSAGRIPTDHAYRFYVDRIMRLQPLTEVERERLAQEIEIGGSSVVERLVQRAIRALSLLSGELGVAVAPSLEDAILERLELIQVSSAKILMVMSIRSGLVHTVYVDLPGEVQSDVLASVTQVLNERLAGLTLHAIKETLPDRLRDTGMGDGGGADELLNIFIQSSSELFDWTPPEGGQVHLGQTSVLAAQPEFNTGERLKGLIELTEQRALLADVLGNREHKGGLKITIGSENPQEALSDFTLVTAEYRVGQLKGVIGVIGPTRMPYEKVIAIVDYTSTLVNSVLGA
jgi:heat-inducible transcriptional repressor